MQTYVDEDTFYRPHLKQLHKQECLLAVWFSLLRVKARFVVKFDVIRAMTMHALVRSMVCRQFVQLL
jgi:hypothetical protein